MYNEDVINENVNLDLADVDEGELDAEETIKDFEKRNLGVDTSDLLGCYLHQIRNFKSLTKEKEEALWADGSAGAREQIINSHLKMVVAITHKVFPYTRNQDGRFMDLVQAGNAGLLSAAKNFKPEKGTKFSTHAYYWVYNAVKKELAKQRCGAISKPGNTRTAFSTIAKMEAQLLSILGRDPTEEEIVTALDEIYSEDKAKELVEDKKAQIFSFDKPIENGEDETTLANTIPDTRSVERMDQEELRVAIDSELEQSLPPRLYFVICARFGLGEFRNDEKTLTEIGEMMVSRGLADSVVTRQRVRQLEGQALRLLKYHPRFSQIFNQ